MRILLQMSVLCLLLPLFAGCNEEDDIKGIFVDKTWYVTDLFKADGKTSMLEGEERIKFDNNRENYRIVFTPETFSARAGDCVFSGKWNADGKKQTIHFSMDAGTSGTDVISKELIRMLEESVRYEGSYIYLRVYTEANTSVLFSPAK